MKKILCLALCLVLALTSATALAADYTLVEKWQRQTAFGNGVKGTVSLSVTGEAEWAQLLRPLDGAELEVRAIRKDGRGQYRLYAVKGEDMVGLTRLFSEEQDLYLVSDLLPDTVLRLSTGGDLINLLTGGREGNAPNWYSAALSLMEIPQTTWEEKWAPVLARYEKNLEMWLESFASAPSVKRDGDTATVLARYDVPADGLKAQMRALWQEALADEELLELLRGQLTPEQQQAYLNPALQGYYDSLMDGLQLGDGVVLEREMTTRGDVVASSVTLPLDRAPGNWTELKLLQREQETTVELTGSEGAFSLTLQANAVAAGSTLWTGTLRYDDGQELPLAVDFTLVKLTSESVDADGRSHQMTNWSLKAEQHRAEGEASREFAPLALEILVHMNSKNAQINPVNLEIGMSLQRDEATVEAQIALTTHSPWVLDELPLGRELNLADMSAEERDQVFADLWRNALVTLMGIQGVVPAEETARPMPTLEPSPSDRPEEAPTTVPAVNPAQAVPEEPTESPNSTDAPDEKPTGSPELDENSDAKPTAGLNTTETTNTKPTEVGSDPTQTPDTAE